MYTLTPNGATTKERSLSELTSESYSNTRGKRLACDFRNN